MATGTTEFVTVTTAANLIPEIWTRYVIEARLQKLVFAMLVNRQLEDELNYGDTLHIPSKTLLTAQTKAAGTAISFETQTETLVNITVSTHEYSAVAVEDIAALQTNRDMAEFYAPLQGYALALAVDDNLAGLVDNLSASNTVGALGTDLSYEDFTRAIQYLDDANAPVEDRVAIISPAQNQAWLNDDHYIQTMYSMLQGSVTDAPEKAYVSSWLDIPIFKSTNVEGSNAAGHDNVLLQRDCLALIMQQAPRTYVQFDINYITDKSAVVDVYGFSEVREDHGVWMQGA